MSIKSDVFFNDYLNTLEWEQSYATVNDKRVIDTGKRSSKICTKKFTVEFPKELEVFCKTCQILSPASIDLVLYKYEKGDFFAPHVDRQRSQNHAYTLLILPPCKSDTDNYFEGGKLKIGSSNINCCAIEDYTYLIFSINILHELEPILKGTRYVFKSQLDLVNPNTIHNAFPFLKTIYRTFDIEVKENKLENNISIKVNKTGDFVTSFHIPIDVDNNNEFNKKPDENLDKKNNSIDDKSIYDPSQQLESDYDSDYYAQPLYRRRLYLRNKINKRIGKPTLRD